MMYTVEVKKGTKQAASFIQSYVWSLSKHGLRDVEHAYKTCSEAKKRAYKDIWYMCKRLGGYDLTVVSATCFTFSAAFMLNEETLYYFTPNHLYIVSC